MMARHWGAVAIFLVSLLIGPGVGLADPQLPARTGAVVDAANIIGANQEQSLAAKAARLQALSNVELVVVTLPSLQGYAIERWGRDLGNRWQVGGSTARGVVLIVAPNDRQVRIEVGDGLAFPDSAAASIVNNIIVPQFRSGEMSGGILAGVDAIARVIDDTSTGSAAGWRELAPKINSSMVGLFAIFGVLVILFVYQTLREGWTWPQKYDPTPGSPSSVGSNDDDGFFFGSSGSSSDWSSSSSSGSSWSSSDSSSSSSSGGFSGSGASGRW